MAEEIPHFSAERRRFNIVQNRGQVVFWGHPVIKKRIMPPVSATTFGIDIELDLPLPTSVNKIWRVSRGQVYRSRAYQRWQKAADALTLTQPQWRNKHIPGRYTATLIINEGMLNPVSDGDNLLKVPLDYAKRLGLVVDDSIKYCRDWHIKLGNDENAPTGARLILRSIK